MVHVGHEKGIIMKDKLRNYLKKSNLDALLITRADSFLGEHYPPESQQLKEVTGFSGSAGLAIITADKAVLFVDSRYTEQAKIQSDWDVFEVPTQTTPSDWILKNLDGKRIGYNAWKHSVTWVHLMETKKIQLREVSVQDWNRLFPIKETHLKPSFDYDLRYCGETTESKIRKIVSALKEKVQNGEYEGM